MCRVSDEKDDTIISLQMKRDMDLTSYNPKKKKNPACHQYKLIVSIWLFQSQTYIQTKEHQLTNASNHHLDKKRQHVKKREADRPRTVYKVIVPCIAEHANSENCQM